MPIIILYSFVGMSNHLSPKPPRRLSATNLGEKCFLSWRKNNMSRGSHPLRSLLLAAALASALAGIACSEHHSYRVYDPYYTDYHTWNDSEVVYYHRWAEETHRDPNRDFRKISPEQQKEYWTWRHNHGDNDRDHGHGH
jgi:protein-tyrosine phosphatase